MDVIYRDKVRAVLGVCRSDFKKLHWHRIINSATRLVFLNVFLPTYVTIFKVLPSPFYCFQTKYLSKAETVSVRKTSSFCVKHITNYHYVGCNPNFYLVVMFPRR